MKRILVVGAGLSGCTLARQLAEAGHEVVIIEKREHIAGNCYDEVNEHGIMVCRYGAHIFHTSSQRVWDYVQRFSEWTPWKHEVIGKINETTFPIPVNRKTIQMLCDATVKTEEDAASWLREHVIPCAEPTNSEEIALSRVGPQLYDAIFKDYTYKQWAKMPAELDASVLARIPVRTNDETGYFSDPYQALPTHGYTEFIKNMVAHPLIRVALNTEYVPYLNAGYDMVCYTGPIDQYFEYTGLPKLEYRSIRFETEHHEVDHYQENSVVNYPSAEETYTRIVEYKHFLNQSIPGKTTIVKEYTVATGDPYYPVPTKENQALYQRYQALAETEEKKGVYFIGRLANYKYYNMDAAILNALEHADRLIQCL